MFRHRHSIHRWHVDKKTSLRKERHKRINKELIELRCLIKSVADEHFCKTWSICMRKIFTNNAKQMSCMLSSEASICKTWYTMMTTVDLENLISSLSSDSWMSWW